MGMRPRRRVSLLSNSPPRERPPRRELLSLKKIGLTSSKSARVFKPKDAKGGCDLDTSKTALVLIEYQHYAAL